MQRQQENIKTMKEHRMCNIYNIYTWFAYILHRFSQRPTKTATKQKIWGKQQQFSIKV